MIEERLRASLGDRYRLERELGAGGMATVYLAHDLKHDRNVALKVLRPELAAVLGAERFVQEIKTTAALQHPHILPLFDSGTADGFLYYVMPYIPGETLRTRLDREKQLGVDEAVKTTTEVADALDYAHRQGVIHRDIKPENILLHDGRPMVADFGIALAVSAAASGRMTETGLSLGTPHYMSPEQATAEKEITARSDVYSLASVLYEMLAGQPPHLGGSAQQIIMKIIAEPVAAVTTLRKNVPPNVAAALARALEKLPADRFATAREFADALTNPAFAFSGTGRSTAQRPPATPYRRFGYIVLGLVLLLAAATLGRFTASRPQPAVVRFKAPFGPGIHLSDGPVQHVAVSPDGKLLVYQAAAGGSTWHLYARAVGTLTAEPIPGTERAVSPFFSPDGRWLAFWVEDQLKRLDLAGGAPVTIAAVPGGHDGTWTDDGRIVYSAGGALWTVRADGGQPALAAAPDTARREQQLQRPAALPGGAAVLATASRGYSTGATDLVRVDLETGTHTVVVSDRALQGAFAAGYLIYALDDASLLAAPFDPRNGVITGAPTTVLENVRITLREAAQYAVSRTGTLVYVVDEPAQLALVDRRGASTAVPLPPSEYHHPRFSPDGRRMLMDISQPAGRDVWVYDLDQGTLVRVSFERDANDPIWTPDGRRVCYATAHSGSRGVWCRGAVEGGQADSVYVGPHETTAGAFAPDGSLILIEANPTNFDLLLRPAGGGQPTPLLSTPFNTGWPALSPDGRWLAYVSDESGQQQVYARPLRSAGDRVQISVGGGTEPAWSKDGRELYYLTDQNGLTAVRLATAPTLRVLDRSLLFTLPGLETASPHTNYDVDARGRFAIVLRPPSSEAVIVLNWASTLRKR
jgi:Tol biopolymer transport system component